MNKIYIALIVIFFVITLTMFIIRCPIQEAELEQELQDVGEFNKYWNKATVNYLDGVYNRYLAGYDYDLWSFYYGEGYYSASIDYCVESREWRALSNGFYQDAIAYFEEANKTAEPKYHELIDTYIDLSNVAIDINWAVYEACEYYESASDFYSRELWDSGDAEIITGGEKIALHDSLIKTHNALLSKKDVLEENI